MTLTYNLYNFSKPTIAVAGNILAINSKENTEKPIPSIKLSKSLKRNEIFIS